MTSKNNENSIDAESYQASSKHIFGIKNFIPNQDTSQIYSTNSFQTPQVNKANSKPMKDENISSNSTSTPCPLKKIVLKPNHNQNSQAYYQNKIVQLQEELLQNKKQSSLKQSSWVKEKNILLSKIQILNFQNAQTKIRNTNLNQINQTMSQVLSQTNKKTQNNSSQNQIQKLKISFSQKEKMIKELQNRLQDVQKKMKQQSQKYNQEQQNHQKAKSALEEWKRLAKLNNQKKLQAEGKILNFMQNTNILRQKILSLPVKDSYLKPILNFLKIFQQNNISEMNMQSSQSQLNLNNFSNQLESSQAHSYISSKPLYQENSSYLLNTGKRQSKQHKYPYTKQSQYYSHRNYNNNFNQYQERPQSGGYDSSEIQEFEDSSNYWKKNKHDQSQQIIYECENCQNCFTQSNFKKHMKECQAISELLKQKNIIQSRLISMKGNKNFQKISDKRISKNKSRVELSQILNMSNISNNKKSNCKKIRHQPRQEKSRRNSYIKKQENEFQKQSMQQEIRKIVQALNETGNKSNRSHIQKNKSKLDRSRNHSRSFLHKDNSYIKNTNEEGQYDDFY